MDIDRRKTNIMYVDKENLHVAEDEEVLKFYCKDDKVNTIAKLLCIDKDLTKEEFNVFLLIFKYKQINIHKLEKIYFDTYNKSKSTFDRAIKTLKSKSIIYVNNTNGITKLYSNYTTNKYIDNIEFIVIEVGNNI